METPEQVLSESAVSLTQTLLVKAKYEKQLERWRRAAKRSYEKHRDEKNAKNLEHYYKRKAADPNFHNGLSRNGRKRTVGVVYAEKHLGIAPNADPVVDSPEQVEGA